MIPRTATLNLTITTFVPIDQGDISYGMTLVTKFPEIFTLTAPPPTYELVISKPESDPNPVQLIFALSDPAYVLIGIYFTAAGSRSPVGRKEFPVVVINRATQTSTMTVADAAIPDSFTYAILVQEAETGRIGLVDPVIINLPPPPI